MSKFSDFAKSTYCELATKFTHFYDVSVYSFSIESSHMLNFCSDEEYGPHSIGFFFENIHNMSK